MRDRVGLEAPRATLGSLMRITVVSAAATMVSLIAWWGLDAVVGRSLLGQLLSVGIGLAVGTVVYLVLCRAWRVRELNALQALRRG
jgi:hypothetical protein